MSDESGATAIEYGLIAAGISLAIIALVNGLGTNLNDKFTSIYFVEVITFGVLPFSGGALSGFKKSCDTQSARKTNPSRGISVRCTGIPVSPKRQRDSDEGR